MTMSDVDIQSRVQSPEAVLRRAYEEFKKTPLARDWPLNEDEVEFQTRIEMFKMAMPYLSRPQSVVFDIGTGAGIAARFFRLMGCRVVSIDSVSASGMSAIENVRLAGVEAMPCDIERDPLPMDTASTDVVIFADVIEHLHHSPKPALEEIMRVLRPGGAVIASTPNATRLTVRLKVLAGVSNWPKVWDFFDEPLSHYGHHHEYTIEEFKGVFERTGFLIDRFSLRESNSLTASLGGINDLQSGSHAKPAGEKSKFYLARRAVWACASAVPRLRSSMTIVARKPPLDR